MNYYHYHRSNSLLQSSLIIRNNTLSPKRFNSCISPRKENSSKHSFLNLDNSFNFNDSLYYSKSLKKQIFSPEETAGQSSEDNYPHNTNNHRIPQSRPLSSSISFSSHRTKRKKILVLDLDETLVHSSFKHFPTKSDIEFSLKFDGVYHRIYVLKRPYVNEFLKRMNELFDLYIFTASIPKYANQILDRLDIHNVIKEKLYRGDCIEKEGAFIKDLSLLQRGPNELILLDNNPISYSANQSNGIPIRTWHDDRNDQELLKLIPLMEFLATVNDVRWVIDRIVSRHQVDYCIVNDILESSKEYGSKRPGKMNKEKDNYNGKSRKENDDYISISKADTTRKENQNRQNSIKLNQKPFNRSCCLNCITNPQCKTSELNLSPNDDNNIINSKQNKNNECDAIKEQVKFVSLNQYILERKSLSSKKGTKEEEHKLNFMNQSPSISRFDLLSKNYNADKRSDSFNNALALSFYNNTQKKKDDNSSLNLLKTDNNTTNDVNALNNNSRSYSRENSSPNINKKNQISVPLATTNTINKLKKGTNDINLNIKKQILCSPQKLHIHSNLNRHSLNKKDMNQSFDYAAINKMNTSTCNSIKKRLMIVKLKEENKLAPINTFGRNFDAVEEYCSLYLQKKKNALLNSSLLLSSQANSTFLIGNNSKKHIWDYNAKKSTKNIGKDALSNRLMKTKSRLCQYGKEKYNIN